MVFIRKNKTKKIPNEKKTQPPQNRWKRKTHKTKHNKYLKATELYKKFKYLFRCYVFTAKDKINLDLNLVFFFNWNKNCTLHRSNS